MHLLHITGAGEGIAFGVYLSAADKEPGTGFAAQPGGSGARHVLCERGMSVYSNDTREKRVGGINVSGSGDFEGYCARDLIRILQTDSDVHGATRAVIPFVEGDVGNGDCCLGAESQAKPCLFPVGQGDVALARQLLESSC